MPTFYLVCQNRNTLLKQAFSWQQLETCFLFPVLHQVSARVSLFQHNIKYRDWMCRWYVQQGRTTRLYTMPCRICLPIKDRRLSSAVLRRVLHTWEFSGMANNKMKVQPGNIATSLNCKVNNWSLPPSSDDNHHQNYPKPPLVSPGLIHLHSKWILNNLFCCCSNLSSDDINS